MKKIEIHIREVDVDDEFNELGHKRFGITTIVDEKICGHNLGHILDLKWKDAREFYLRNRHNVPFRKIRRDHEPLED